MFNLLVCDDHPPIRTVVRLLAREASCGCDVTEVGNAAALLDVLRGRHPFDLLTLDLSLPGASGLSILPAIKAIRSELPVMVLSADESPESVTAALDNGASSYVYKSSPERALFDALKGAMRGRLSVPSSYGPPDEAEMPADGLVLTPRQREVLNCLLRGMRGKQIARALALSEGTVKSHTVAVFRSLNVTSRAQVIVEAQRRGITLG